MNARGWSSFPTPFTQRRNSVGEHEIVVFADLDLLLAPQVEEAAVAALGGHPSRLILDLSTVAFVDSAGLAAVLHISRIAEERRCPFGVFPPPASVHKVFEIAGLADVLTWLSPADRRR